MRLFARVLFFALFLLYCLFTTGKTFAETTDFRSAGSITTDGSPSFTNLSSCSSTDGATCNRALAASYGNLYFRNFGDFGIPDGSTVTGVRLRVAGKTNLSLYTGVSQGTSYTANCQFPSWLWEMWVLNGTSIKTYSATGTVSNSSLWCLTTANIKNNNLTWRINYSSGSNWSANIDNFEIAYDYISPPTPTPTPTVAAFLDLPWDYGAKGLSFNEAALAVSSYFDHEYPLLSSGLSEIDHFDTIIDFRGPPRVNRFYSRHDGYDYALSARVNIGDHVLAAASGWATFRPEEETGGGGNVIKIDHENGYQTWYEHLDREGLITNIEGQRIHVNQGQIIGKVGMTGKTTGAHIHFGVFQDKNKDGNFEDNVPDGVTDPYGWQSTDPDPWENYSFLHKGVTKTGNKSYWLWTKKLSSMKGTLTPSGGSFTNERFKFDFSTNSTSGNLTLNFSSQPNVKVSKTLQSIGSSLIATAKDVFGNLVTQFNSPYTLTIDFADFDLSNVNIDTISIYSSSDGVTWIKEPTILDIVNKKVSSQINHFTHFAVMAQRLDTEPPETDALLAGDKGKGNWLRSDVEASLNSDDKSGMGVDYIVFKKDGNDWEQYIAPIIFSTEGHHKIEFYSVDKDGNIEDAKTTEFDIDKTLPIISSNMTTEGGPYTKNLWTNKDIVVSFSCKDSLSGVLSITEPITVTADGENQKVTGECQDKAGNKSEIEATGINIDKTPPEINISATPNILWPPSGKMIPVLVSGHITEQHLANKKILVHDEYSLINSVVNDFGETIKLEAKRNGDDLDGRNYIIEIEAEDLAGNRSIQQTKIVVPHDQGE